LDALKCRAFGWPERSILEGQFGTKAESEAHADFAITLTESRHADIVLSLNWHAVNQIIRLNWGKEYENKVFIKQAPIADLERQYLKEVYKLVLSNPEYGAHELASMDLESLRDRLGIPTQFPLTPMVDDTLIPYVEEGMV
jgi:hypothetical protein